MKDEETRKNKRIMHLQTLRRSMILDAKHLVSALEIFDYGFVDILTKRLRKTKIKYNEVYKKTF